MLAAVIGFTGLAFLNEVWEPTMMQLIPDQVSPRVTAYDF
jgi:hypothetical protein